MNRPLPAWLGWAASPVAGLCRRNRSRSTRLVFSWFGPLLPSR